MLDSFTHGRPSHSKGKTQNFPEPVSMMASLQSLTPVVKTCMDAKPPRLVSTKSELDFNRRTLDILGLWPVDGSGSRLARYWDLIFPVFTLLRMGCVIAIETMSIAHASGDTSKTVEFTIMIIFYLHAGVKYSCLYLKQKRVRDLYLRIEGLTVTLVAVQRSNAVILKNCDLICYRINRYPTFASFGVIAASLIWLAILSLTERDIPFFMWFPFETQSSPAFEMTLAILLMGFLFDLVVVVICDVAGVVSVLQVAGLLQMLSCDIKHAKQITNETGRLARESLASWTQGPTTSRASQQNGGVTECVSQLTARPSNGVAVRRLMADRHGVFLAMKRMEEIMKTNVKHHQQIISLVKEIQSIFNPILAEQIMFNGLLGLVGLYVSTMTKTTFVKSVVMAACILGGVLELFIMCWICDMLTLASERVFEATYSCDWLEESAAFKRSLRLLMTRAQKDLVLKAGGITVSRRTFRTVCKVAYYFQSLLSKIYTRS